MNAQTDGLSAKDLSRICSFIYEQSGIRIGADKQIMLEARLKRRMNALNMLSYAEYCNYVFAGGQNAAEIIPLIDAVSTNKTDFYREKAHFDVLTATALPEFTAAHGSSREFRLWSAGCSSGEEPYTLAIVLSEYARAHAGFRFKILATDISTLVLEKAQRGIFTAEVASPVPVAESRRYFMRSRDRSSDRMRIVPELRETIEFRRLNLMEDFGLAERFDAIFCRNVIIYFDRPTQERLFHKFSVQLVDGGYMFVGHSESLHSLNVPFKPVAPAVYRKNDDRRSK